MIRVPQEKQMLFEGLAKNGVAYKTFVEILEVERDLADSEYTKYARMAVYDPSYRDVAIESRARSKALDEVIDLLNTNRP